MYKLGLFIILILTLTNCYGQSARESSSELITKNEIVGGGCDGCELMFVGMPSSINSIDTSAAWSESGQKIVISGTVFNRDGITPASNVLIYYWQTDNKGYYSSNENMEEAAKRHGEIRGWLKTDGNGKYSIYTIKPAPYPNNDMPAHIHISIKEASIDDEYYIDEFVFDDDPFLTRDKRNQLENRGGSGILQLQSDGELLTFQHNIILGLNIPHYPEN